MNWTRKVNPVRRRTAPNETVRGRALRRTLLGQVPAGGHDLTGGQLPKIPITTARKAKPMTAASATLTA